MQTFAASAPKNIAIIDFLNQDPGLKLLYREEADYFVYETQPNLTLPHRLQFYKMHGLYEPTQLSTDNEDEIARILRPYSILFVVCSIVSCVSSFSTFPVNITSEHLLRTLRVIQKCRPHLQTVTFFDNSDYDACPYDLLFVRAANRAVMTNTFEMTTNGEQKCFFLKRAFALDMNSCPPHKYAACVYPFPYIMFGYNCNIDIITRFRNGGGGGAAALPRLFFAGAIYRHTNVEWGVDRDRETCVTNVANELTRLEMQSVICFYCFPCIDYENYIGEMSASMFCLDVPGAGDPNKRTFEILASGTTLRMAGPFAGPHKLPITFATHVMANVAPEDADELCDGFVMFFDEHDLCRKIQQLLRDPELYKRCLRHQNKIVEKYMNPRAIRASIDKHLFT